MKFSETHSEGTENIRVYFNVGGERCLNLSSLGLFTN